MQNNCLFVFFIIIKSDLIPHTDVFTLSSSCTGLTHLLLLWYTATINLLLCTQTGNAEKKSYIPAFLYIQASVNTI